MSEDDIINEYGIDFAIESITCLISQKMDEYKNTRDQKIQEELSNLIEERNKIYNNDEEIIRKYLKLGRE